MSITYKGYGACRRVPGSKHCLMIDGQKIFIDFGSVMGTDEAEGDGLEKKLDLGFKVSDINAILLTHAHADHVGDLIRLQVEGDQELESKQSDKCLEAKIYGTKATGDLLKVQLAQVVSGDYFSTKRYNDSIRGKKGPDGKFVQFRKSTLKADNKNRILDLYLPADYHQEMQVLPNVKATFYDAGHIIGSSQILLEITGEVGKKTKVLFCGDTGRKDIDTAFLKYPDTNLPKDIDYVFIESTYGARVHEAKENTLKKLEDSINYAYSHGGKVVAGAFSIQRTQTLLEDLFKLYKAGKLPEDFKIYLDSPSAIEVNKIIQKHPECLDDIAVEEFSKEENAFKNKHLIYVNKSDESKLLAEQKGSYMVLGSHGMYEGGRIMKHLKTAISDPNSVVLITGYQAPRSLGARIEKGSEQYPQLRIEGSMFDFKAKVERLRGYSAHADKNELLEHLTAIVDKDRVKGIFVIHGEEEGSLAIAEEIKNSGYKNVIVPFERKEYPLL